MAVEKPDLPVFSYKFQGVFTANVFSELSLHTESKMIIFTIGLLQGFTCRKILYTVGKEAEMIDIHQNFSFV